MPVDVPRAFRILNRREDGASYAILTIANQLGLNRVLYSRPQPWVNGALAMIVGRLVYAGNTTDETTVIAKVHEIKADYGIEKVVFVGDIPNGAGLWFAFKERQRVHRRTMCPLSRHRRRAKRQARRSVCWQKSPYPLLFHCAQRSSRARLTASKGAARTTSWPL